MCPRTNIWTNNRLTISRIANQQDNNYLLTTPFILIYLTCFLLAKCFEYLGKRNSSHYHHHYMPPNAVLFILLTCSVFTWSGELSSSTCLKIQPSLNRHLSGILKKKTTKKQKKTSINDEETSVRWPQFGISYCNIWAIFIYKSPPCFQPTIESIGLSVQKKQGKTDFQDSHHLEFSIRTILAIFISTSHPDASYQFSNQLALWFRKISEKNSLKMTAIGIGTTLAVFDLQVTLMLPT